MAKQRDFLANVESHVARVQLEQKKEEIGKVIGSLQKPISDVLQSIALHQITSVEALIKSLQWQKAQK